MSPLYTVVHFATACEHEFELQFSLADDTNRLVLVTGTCCDGIISPEHPCWRGARGLDVTDLLGAKKNLVLLSVTELKVVETVLKQAGFRCVSVGYYAIINLNTSRLVAEHRLTEEGSEVYESGQDQSGRSLRARYHA